MFCIKSQNLVPNPGFEIIDTCYLHQGAFGSAYVTFWDSPTWGSPDAFNICSISPINATGVPNNYFGFQYPHSGNGYAGAGFCNTHNYREYIQVKLDSSLVAHQEYCASYYVVSGNYTKMVSNNFGMYFSNIHTYIPSFNGVLSATPQINDTNIVSDTLNWTLIYGHFTAQGGERYLIIGNFYSDSLTDTVHLNGTDNESYYYIDDINVHCCTCDSLNHEGISELTKETEITISPNPATTSISITATNNIKEIKLINLLGEEVIITNYQLRISPSTPLRVTDAVSVDVSSVSKGIYFVEVTDAKDNVINRKVVVQ